MRFHLSRRFHTEKPERKQLLKETEAKELQTLAYSVSNKLGHRPYAFAPIRTRPQRTYDPLKEVPKPEGSHVPMVLAKYLKANLNAKSTLKDSLTSFGKTSGLFNSLEVKRKGNKESDPFQIVVKTFGQTFNLVDVGYGISQVLPIVVDVLQDQNEGTFLLQQPEVHLHPKAQAELGSFLVSLAKEKKQRFLIETHSDYLIDRIRMDVRDKKIPANDALILYFEKTNGGVQIHELTLDEMGNIINAPPTYRQFFLEEERRMLGV
jgi:predicted ATPase